MNFCRGVKNSSFWIIRSEQAGSHGNQIFSMNQVDRMEPPTDTISSCQIFYGMPVSTHQPRGSQDVGLARRNGKEFLFSFEKYSSAGGSRYGYGFFIHPTLVIAENAGGRNENGALHGRKCNGVHQNVHHFSVVVFGVFLPCIWRNIYDQ